MQLLDAMAPFIGAGVIDPAKLAEHVLRNGFGIKDPAQFIQQPPPEMAAQGGMPGMPPAQGGGMPPMPAQGGMPPELAGMMGA